MALPEVSQVVMDANTVTTITNNINSLYSNAINQLTSYTLGVVALVGVLIPVLVTLIQWLNIKSEKKNLENLISDEIDRAKCIIRDEIKAELKNLITAEEKALIAKMESKYEELEKKISCADAASFHLQGSAQVDNKYFGSAVEDYCLATQYYLLGGDEQNGQRTLKLILRTCMPKVDKFEYEKYELEDNLSQLIATLKNYNDNNRYTDTIKDLTRLSKEAKNREPKVEE